MVYQSTTQTKKNCQKSRKSIHSIQRKPTLESIYQRMKQVQQNAGIQQKTPPGNNNKRDWPRPQKAFQVVKQHSWKQK